MAEDEEKQKSQSEEIGEEAGRSAGKRFGRQMAEKAAARGAGSAAGTGAGTAAGTTAGTAAGTGAAAAGGTAAGAAAGSAVPVAGTIAGAAVGAIVGKFGKYLAIAAATGIVLIIIIFLVIIFAVIALISGGGAEGDTPPPTRTEICSNIETTMTALHIQRINDNEDVYRAASAAADIPWEMLAAIHYEETNNDASAPNMYQFDPPPPGVNVNDFAAASAHAANFIQNKADNGPVGRPLRADMNPANPEDAQSIKDAFWGYNGRADYMRDIAESLGYDPVTEGYEGSFYVMNNWDGSRVGMTIKYTDPDTGELIVRSVVRDGAWKIFIVLRNATYDDAGKIVKLNDICTITGDGSVPTGCPMTGTITSPYGFNNVDYVNLGWHYGVDIADGPGHTEIHSTITGTARTTTTLPGGFQVIVENDRFAVYFLHLLSTDRVEGPVTVGQVIALEDASGTGITGEHIHYAIYRDGVRVNPYDYMPVSLNYEHPADNDFTGVSKPSGGWGTCNALP